MAKYINNKIKSGRVAGSVFAVRYGEVIERAYNPYVSNPKSTAQVQNRARLKLVSQLSAVMAPVIAIPREGSVSTRNLFTRQNYPLTSYSNDQAQITLTSVQLTKGVVGLPGVGYTRQPDNNRFAVYLTGASTAITLDRVVYVLLDKQADGKLRLVTSVVSSTPGESGNFASSLPIITDPGVIYAYGLRFNTDAARVLFGNITAEAAESYAKLLVTRSVTDADVTVTETRGVAIIAE